MLQVTPIPAFNDNYIWALQLSDSPLTIVVDPGDAAPVQQYLQTNRLQLHAILVTHHHADHTGGVAELVNLYHVPVFGSHKSTFKGVTHPLKSGDSIELLNHTLEITEVPGHTLDHICYYQSDGEGQLFCGDTLFLAGCGRLFEGSPTQMLTAMQYFKSLPATTQVYCTHEYSLANLAFAEAVEPDNDAIKRRIEACKQQRAQNKTTLPSTIGEELRINPFLRTDQPSVISAAHRFDNTKGSEQAVFKAIREWKNQF